MFFQTITDGALNNSLIVFDFLISILSYSGTDAKNNSIHLYVYKYMDLLFVLLQDLNMYNLS